MHKVLGCNYLRHFKERKSCKIAKFSKNLLKNAFSTLLSKSYHLQARVIYRYVIEGNELRRLGPFSLGNSSQFSKKLLKIMSKMCNKIGSKSGNTAPAPEGLAQ